MPSSPDPFLLLAAALALVPLALAVCLRAPALIALSFVAVLCLFSASTWGQLQEDNTLYSRGTGLFAFSLLNLLLWIAVAAALVRTSVRRFEWRAPSPFLPFAVAFSFLLCSHLALGVSSGIDALTVLGYNGLLNVLNMALFSVLLLLALRSEADRRRLLLLILALAAVRAVFGLVRYAFFGGDDANPYRNFERLDITLVYFDIADNYIAALAAFCLAWVILMPETRISLPRRFGLLLLLAMELATVVLSFRRSSLIGLGLMSAVLLWRLPWQRRLIFAGAGSVALLAAAGTLMRERLAANSAGGGLLASLLYDVGPDRATDVSRFYELEAAAQSLDGHWLFGLGSWGSFYGNEDALGYHFGKFDFVHSGFGHLLLKSGFVGLALFVALLLACVAHYIRRRGALHGNSALLADAGMAGLLFWMPTLLIGTPVIEFRTMLLLGLTLAMPYLAMRMPLARPRLVSLHHAAA